MKRAKLWRNLFAGMGLVLSHLACAHIPYAYCNCYWLGKNGLTSAPASIVFYFLIPYGIGIAICFALAYLFHVRGKSV